MQSGLPLLLVRLLLSCRSLYTIFIFLLTSLSSPHFIIITFSLVFFLYNVMKICGSLDHCAYYYRLNNTQQSQPV